MSEQPPKIEIDESREKEERLMREIAEYQRDRNNKQAREKALKSIKERTLLLPKKEYESYIDEKYDFLTEQERNLRKQMFGFSHTPETRAVLNKDALNESFLPYIKTHEETEILEEGPFPDEKRKWEEEHHGQTHPQENIVSHIEATYEEYRQARRDGKLDEHHKYIVVEIRRLMTDDSLKEMIKNEEAQRNRIYEEIKLENNMPEQPATIEQEKEKTFREYMENLKLAPEDFNKKILDIGSGEGDFAAWAQNHGVSDTIYSLEKSPNYQAFAEKTTRGEAEYIPFKDESFDMIISHASMPILLYEKDDSKKALHYSVLEMLRVVRQNGEIRLVPLAEWKQTGKLRELVKVFSAELATLVKDRKISFEKISLGKAEYHEGDLEQFLYKIKKLS